MQGYAVHLYAGQFVPEFLADVWLGLFIDIDIVLANQLMQLFQGKDGLLLDFSREGPQYWSASDTLPSGTVGAQLLRALWVLLKAIFTFAVLSLVATFVFRIGMMASAALVVIYGSRVFEDVVNCSECCRRPDFNPAIVYRAVPLVGAHAAELSRRGKSGWPLLLAFVMLMVMTYIFFGVAFSAWSLFLSADGYKQWRGSEHYILYFESLELLLLIAARTRTTLVYLPKLLTGLNVVYLFYIFWYSLPFTGLAVGCLSCATMLVVLSFILFFEVPAASWNPFVVTTPSIQHPRQAYHPTPLARLTLGFDIWTIAYPPALRSEFLVPEQAELSGEVEPIQFNFFPLPNPDFDPNADPNPNI